MGKPSLSAPQAALAISVDDRRQAARVAGLSRDMMQAAHLATPCGEEQVMALLSAAVVLIERRVGVEQAAPQLMAMLGPTVTAWAGRRDGESVQ